MPMEKRIFGKLGEISSLTLGGGGIGQVWGPTSRYEAVATVLEAVEGGINFLDVAPAYGRGEAELVVGEAFNGRLPDGVRISTKCMLGNPPRQEVRSRLERSLDKSLTRTKLNRIDLFFLHGHIVPDRLLGSVEGTSCSLFVEVVRPALEQLVARGRIGAWGISGIGVPTAILETINEDPPPVVVQAVTNLLDSAGAMRRFDEPARPREIIAAAYRRGIAVMGIRAVQAGALTDSLDRDLSDTHPEMVDYRRAAPFRALAKEAGESAAVLAHRYALSIPGVATVVLGVKNRTELRECLTAAARGPLDSQLVARIDTAVGRV
jgi:aryl-alcohol dehydrogenase-like predicted oxidoreductase